MAPRLNFREKTTQIYERAILNQQRFHDFFKVDNQEDQLVSSAFKKAYHYQPQIIKRELERVRCQLQKGPTQGTVFILTKIMIHLLDGLHLHRQGILNVKRMISDNRKTRIVYLPIYKSYADVLILHYIQHFYDMELGFTFGNYEDSPKIGFVDRLLKRIGTVLIKRNPQQSLSNQRKSNSID